MKTMKSVKSTISTNRPPITNQGQDKTKGPKGRSKGRPESGNQGKVIPEYLRPNRSRKSCLFGYAINDTEETHRRLLLFMKRLSSSMLYRAIADWKQGSQEAYEFLNSSSIDYWCEFVNLMPNDVRANLKKVREQHLIRKRSRYFKPKRDAK